LPAVEYAAARAYRMRAELRAAGPQWARRRLLCRTHCRIAPRHLWAIRICRKTWLAPPCNSRYAKRA
jgi:hypothetical protein